MKKNISNLLIIDGGSVKTDEEGIVSGLGIVFGSENEPDQSKERDFFTKETFVRKRETFEVPLYYNHGFGPIDSEIGEAVLTKTDTGWEATAKLDLASEFGKKVYESVKKTPHGFSTGALQHLVKRETKNNNTNFLKQWVVGEISLTERPAERKAVVQSVKSVNGEIVTTDLWDNPIENIFLYDKDDKEFWNLTQGVETLDKETPVYKVGLKVADAEVISFKIPEAMAQPTQIEEVLSQMQSLLDTYRPETSKEELTEATVAGMVEKALKDFEQKLSANKNSEASAEDELADLRDQLSDREDALTKANEEIARLKILAGAKETINNNKGK